MYFIFAYFCGKLAVLKYNKHAEPECCQFWGFVVTIKGREKWGILFHKLTCG